MAIKPWEPRLSWQEVDLKATPVWMQIHGLLMDRSNEQTAGNIGEAVGRVLAVVGEKNAYIWCLPFLQVQVLYHMGHPLFTGYWLPRHNMDVVRVHFKFDGISGLCYGCELLSHNQGSCAFQMEVKNGIPS